MIISTLTPKGKATIPEKIRRELDLNAGDKIYFEIINGNVVLRKVSDFHQALSNTLSEWKSKDDDEAYKDL